MPGISKEIATHKLNVDPFYPSVRQIRRKFNSVINDAVREEVEKLLENGSIRESKYPQWVANMVMVKKKNEKWRMCVDFTDLNKAYPKDLFPLPHIDQLIDTTAGHELLSFLDNYSSYNQILMEEEDQEKITFITHQGTYYYKVMPFGLKNAGATYQRLVTKMFKDQLGKIMEVYIDDMLVKSKRKGDHIDHLREAFDILKRCHKLFAILKKDNGLQWNSECVNALKELKTYLYSPLPLAKAEPGERLLLFLAMCDVAVSAVLVQENKGTQSPIYYISKTLVDAETRYPHLEKLALPLVVTSRKLKPYFQCQPISVVMTFPLRSILHKPELLGKLAKWTIELSEHDITYQPRMTIKSQVLADFVANFSAKIMPEVEREIASTSTKMHDQWVLYTDCTSNVS
uniref:Uncharacterized protein LOC104210618 n=1 Tax=Nicotiana sylvestris TaxID=4096 RepID=A0A1U7UUJ1_NICSY|nr:PREDICTED: uncharacterized protein LOC104210618 [Nicotiana sylvestris]